MLKTASCLSAAARIRPSISTKRPATFSKRRQILANSLRRKGCRCCWFAVHDVFGYIAFIRTMDCAQETIRL